MTVLSPEKAPTAASSARTPRGFLEALEIDTRLLGMVGALIVIWVGFDIVTGGLFITPRNLFNLSVQTASVAVMVTGMVLVIVTRNIDLSVGSLLGFLAMIMGVLQVDFLPAYLGFDHPLTWALTLLGGIVLGGLVGALNGFITAYGAVPSFIVTLGGLLVWRGAAWWVTAGRTVAPLDQRFQLMGGGIEGTIGATWSWIVGAAAIALIVIGTYRARARRRTFNFPVRPVWAEITVAGVMIALVVAFVMVMNSYDLPARAAAQWAERNGVEVPEGGIAHGIAIPVLIVAGIAFLMNVLARRTRFGRYVFAIGGNPEAADLAGVNSRRVIVLVFTLMGVLTAIGAAIAAARLQAAGNNLGTLDELRVIAAAVIGGTSLAGGVGSIVGALIGAVVMQSLQSGMGLIGVDTALQSMIIGVVLVIAVWIDSVYQKKRRK